MFMVPTSSCRRFLVLDDQDKLRSLVSVDLREANHTEPPAVVS